MNNSYISSGSYGDGGWSAVRRAHGHTVTVTIGAERLCLTAHQREDGSLGEVDIRWGKHGTCGAGLLDTYAAALSAGLRHQIPLPDLIRPGLGLWFAPNGRTDDPEIPRVRSAIDYVTRRLAIDWLPYPDRAALGVFTLAERVRTGPSSASGAPRARQRPAGRGSGWERR